MLARATDDRDELRSVALSAALANGVELTERAIKDLLDEVAKANECAGKARIREGTRELPFEISTGSSVISGTIDWLLPVEKEFDVIDFKTGIREITKAEARAANYETQMLTYALAAESITGKNVAATNLVFPSAGIVIRHEVDDTRRNEGRRLIDDIVSRIEKCDYAVEKKPPCESCIFHINGMCWEDRLKKKRAQ